MATMNDVARKAGVSLATVSAVMNRSAYVSPELTARVTKAAEALNYRVNTLARSLKVGATRTVGMLVPGFAAPDPFFSEVVQGAEVILRANDYSLLLGQTQNDVMVQSRHIASFRARLIDGLLIFQAAGDDPELQRLLEEKRPVIFVGRVPTGIAADVVATDIEGGTFLGVSHLLEKGRRRVGLIVQRRSLSLGEFRVQGWHRAHAALGVKAVPDLVVESDFSSEAAFEATLQLLGRKHVPDAVFVDNLAFTIGVVRALQHSGLTGAVEVLSSDDADWLDVFHVPISTIVQPGREVGETAARLFLDRVTDPERPYRTLLLAPTLKIR